MRWLLSLGLLLATSGLAQAESTTDAELATSGPTQAETTDAELLVAADERFGVIVVGSSADGQSAESRADEILRKIGLRFWYSFSQGISSSVPGTQQIQLARPPASPETVARIAQRYPGSHWILGNEANVPGQDNIAPDAFATWFYAVTQAIRGVDPNAVFIGPNSLNWDQTCTACVGYRSAHDWSDGFVTAYRTAYGADPPIDIWGMHVYDVDWTNTPLVNSARGVAQIERAREWLDRQPGLANKPIWVTEFGVIFGFESYTVAQVDGVPVVKPVGEWRQAAVDTYVHEMVTWFTSRGAEVGVHKWFFFSALPLLEPSHTQASGVALLRGPASALELTSEARVYLRHAGAISN